MKRILTIIIIICPIQYLGAQSFHGKLVYEFHSTITDQDLLDKLDLLNIPNPAETKDNFHEYLISGSLLASKSRVKGHMKYKQLLDETRAIIQFPSGRIEDYYATKITSKPKYELVKKTKTHKEILGYNCRKYEFKTAANRKVSAWITEEIAFNSTFSDLPFFDKFFYEEGLVLELTIQHPSGDHHWVVRSIELKRVTAQDIKLFFDQSDH